MIRGVRLAAALAVALAVQGGVARAQFYPGGYGGWGWGGWGGHTVNGDVAAGLGMYGMGAGIYNVETAQARAINANTAIRWNNYIWSNFAEAEQRRENRVAAERNQADKARAQIRDRIRNNPTEDDINSGDALNVALVQATNPRTYLRALPGAEAEIPGADVRNIPFQYAAEAITISINELVSKESVPEELKGEGFAPYRDRFREAAAQLRKEVEQDGKPDPATVQKVRDILKEARAKAEEMYPAGSKERLAAAGFIKGLYGLTRLLEIPAMEGLLTNVEKQKTITVADLLLFMKAYNLRFGVAETGPQRMVYQELYPLLDRMADAASGNGQVANNVPQGNPRNVGEFFSGMNYEDFNPRKPPQPRNGQGQK